MNFLNRIIFGNGEDYYRRNVSYEVSTEKDEYNNNPASSPRFLESEYQHFDLNFLFPFELENEDEENDDNDNFLKDSSKEEFNESEENLKILSLSNEYLLYSFSTKVNLINLVTNRIEFVFRYHELPIIDMKRLNSTIFCSISFDRTLCFWDVNQKKLIYTFRHDEESHLYFTHLKIIKNRNSQTNNLVLLSSEVSEFFLLLNLIKESDPSELDDEETTIPYTVKIIKKIRRFNDNEDRLKKFIVLKNEESLFLPSISNTNPNNLIVENVIEVTDYNIYNFDLKQNTFMQTQKFKKKIKIIKNINFIVKNNNSKKRSKPSSSSALSSQQKKKTRIKKFLVANCYGSSFVFVLNIFNLKVLKKLNCNLFYNTSSSNDDFNECLKIKSKNNNLFIFTRKGISVFNSNFECLIHNRFDLSLPLIINPKNGNEHNQPKQDEVRNHSKNFLFLKNNIICYYRNSSRKTKKKSNRSRKNSKQGMNTVKGKKSIYNKIKFLKLNLKTNKLKEIKTIMLKNRVQKLKKINIDDVKLQKQQQEPNIKMMNQNKQVIDSQRRMIQQQNNSNMIRFLTFSENENFLIIWNNVWKRKKRKNKLAISFMCL